LPVSALAWSRDVCRRLADRAATVSGAGTPPLVGTAARRRRALAHLSPIFDLHLYRARNPSDVEWSAYDFIALTQLTVDTIALSSGLDGNFGASRAAVLAEMARTAAAMAPQRPADEHRHVAAHVLDHLLRHDEPTPYFAVDYADPDADWRTVTQSVRVLYETLAADGSTLHVNVDNAAVALLLIATNRSLEDEHEAVIAVMQAQASSGRLDAAIDSAEDALTLSRTYAANVRRMIVEAERDVTRVDYVTRCGPNSPPRPPTLIGASVSTGCCCATWRTCALTPPSSTTRSRSASSPRRHHAWVRPSRRSPSCKPT
jgi:hypothetical protein